ncbi:hypothetical protein DFS34DRAFT_165271 [Phlyctochytrium arcticum]|nr:hypothetical protein DFS34DRAFT_165271 [Phlyctochytrium arcticum]
MSAPTRFLLVGTAFGFVLEKTKVYEPSIIIDQMLLQKFTMVQMFLTATAGGMLIMSTLEAVGYFKRSPKNPIGLGLNKLGGLGGNLIGGVILGSGMSLSGACPGTVLVQLGAGVRSAWAVMAGALFASSIYGYLLRWINTSFPRFAQKGKSSPTLDQQFGIKYTSLAIGATIVCVAGLRFLNSTFPWTSESPYLYSNATHLTFDSIKSIPTAAKTLAWSPVIGGICVALIQGTSLLTCGQPLGASSAYVEAASLIVTSVDKKWRERAPYYASFLGSNSIMMAAGMVAGGALSTFLSGASSHAKIGFLNTPSGAIANFAGGALLLFGARLAGGCTSGHGISGMAQLGLPSIVTVIGMFAGGIVTAFAVY